MNQSFADAATSAEHLPPITITIDGPAGAGKSSVARRLARRLGLDFLDTGAMYRAVALLAIENGIDLKDERRAEPLVVEITKKSCLYFDWSSDPPRLHVRWPKHADVTERIRDADVTRAVSIVARMPAVRRAMVAQQRLIRDEHPRLVTEGRDQGSVVFPDAEVILYLDATAEERARRRAAQLRETGRASEIDESQILEEIIRRDDMDRSRPDGPLMTPERAVVVDTTTRTEDEVVDRLESIVRSKVGPHVAATLRPPLDD